MARRLVIAALILSYGIAKAQTSTCSTLTTAQSPGFWWSCVFPAFCSADYDAFPQRAKKDRHPVTDTQLTNRLIAMWAGQVTILKTAPVEGLQAALIDALNVRFLIDGVRTVSTKVMTIQDQVYPYPNEASGTYRERQLLFTDPYIGTFKGILLTPNPSAGTTSARIPVVLALHGHTEQAENYRDTYAAREYPRNGLGILMITSRVMDPWLGEHEVSKNLLLNGFTLMGLHVYEALIALKYLGCQPEVNSERLGLIGHSGGSSAGNLLIRLAPDRIKAYVSDLTIDYSMLNIPEPYHCETIPNVHHYHQLINDFTTAARPVRTVPYEYKTKLPNGTTISAIPEIISFFKTTLSK
jgi:hypothetical protein